MKKKEILVSSYERHGTMGLRAALIYIYIYTQDETAAPGHSDRFGVMIQLCEESFYRERDSDSLPLRM